MPDSSHINVLRAERHSTAEDIIVELVDQEGNVVPSGTAGEVVVTHLATSEFPFIRYRTGDVAVMSEGSCAW